MNDFNRGDHVRIIDDEPWTQDGRSIGVTDVAGKVGVITHISILRPSDMIVELEDGLSFYVSPECLEPFQPESEKATTTKGQVNVDVQIRFFVGDEDVTEAVKSLIKS